MSNNDTIIFYDPIPMMKLTKWAPDHDPFELEYTLPFSFYFPLTKEKEYLLLKVKKRHRRGGVVSSMFREERV